MELIKELKSQISRQEYQQQKLERIIANEQVQKLEREEGQLQKSIQTIVQTSEEEDEVDFETGTEDNFRKSSLFNIEKQKMLKSEIDQYKFETEQT